MIESRSDMTLHHSIRVVNKQRVNRFWYILLTEQKLHVPFVSPPPPFAKGLRVSEIRSAPLSSACHVRTAPRAGAQRII